MAQKEKNKKQWENDQRETRKNDLREARKNKSKRIDFFLSLEKEN